MISLARGPQKHNPPQPAPHSWDYVTCECGKTPCPFVDDMALVTCSQGHTSRMTVRIHAVADDGTVSPSYVCPIDGCAFHDFVRLDGWQGRHATHEGKP